MTTLKLDAGKASHSPSSEFMELVDVDHMSDFAQVVDYLKKNLDSIINEVHGFFDKLLLDNEKIQLNSPPALVHIDDSFSDTKHPGQIDFTQFVALAHKLLGCSTSFTKSYCSSLLEPLRTRWFGRNRNYVPIKCVGTKGTHTK